MAKYRIVLISTGKYRVEHKGIYTIFFWYKESKLHETTDDAREWIGSDIKYYNEQKELKRNKKLERIKIIQEIES
jgi:hypothetical protein